MKIETIYYPPHRGLYGLQPSNGSIEAWTGEAETFKDVFLVARAGEDRTTLEVRARAALD